MPSPDPPLDPVELLGVRHHGPGSARAVASALPSLRPDVVLIEGPPEADAIAGLAADPEMRPPVALLAYASGRSAFWPFAEFSPEWQALRYALAAGIPVRFIDLPAATMLAGSREASGAREADPLAELAKTAGYDDPERWWEDVVEHRQGGAFAAIEEAMTELRADESSNDGHPDAAREAYMRKQVRQARKAGHRRIAVVCGAWHVPALRTMPTARSDDERLRGLPKTKISMTWVPWTHGRLAFSSGYGAGVMSPGWYHHLFTVADRPISRWMTATAHLLRDEDLPVSSAHVIEAVRLAETLAALRDRPLAGLTEVMEATRVVLCEGSEAPVRLIEKRLVVGERLGEVPASTPMVPLQSDLRAEQRRLRFPAKALETAYDLDLRRPIDADRSRLLHRLRLLDVEWGSPGEAWGKGTFREPWTVEWRPELDVALIEASVWGTTVGAAASARAESLAGVGSAAESPPPLSRLTELTERCLLADLPDALASITEVVTRRAALDPDVLHLMEALPALVRAYRYGDVRGTPVESLRAVIGPLVTRICIGLPTVVTALDDDSARALLRAVDSVHAAIALLSNDADGTTDQWLDAIGSLPDRSDLHGLLAGRFLRILLDAGRIERPAVAQRLARISSVGEPPARTAAWIEGFLSDSGLLLVHDEVLLRLLDEWVRGLSEAAFPDVLPLLRRTFGLFAPPERRALGERLRQGSAGSARGAEPAVDDELDVERAAAALRTVELILGGGP